MKREATIVRIIARLNVGGPAQQAVWLSARLTAPAWRTILVTGQLAPGEADMSDLARRHGVVPVVVPQLGRTIRPWDDLAAFLAVARLLWRERPDLVHTHTAKAGALGRAAAWWYNLWHPSCRCRVVHTFHGHVFAGYFSRWMTRGFVWIERWLAARTDRIIAVSEQVRREVLSLGIGTPDRVSVVPLGIELEPFLRLQGEGGGDRPVTIGIVGRLVPVKNHRMFLDAASCVVRRAPCAVRFLVVGDGELRGELERYAVSVGLNGSVRFLGWRRDLPVVYRDLDVVALTSVNEGSPVSVIEALAAGRAVVATDVGGVRELLAGEVRDVTVIRDVWGRNGRPRRWGARQPAATVGDEKRRREAGTRDRAEAASVPTQPGRLARSHAARPTGSSPQVPFGGSVPAYEVLPHGLLVPPGDAEAFAEALRRVIEDESLRRRLGEAGRRFVADRLSLERLVADIERLYRKLLGMEPQLSAVSDQPSAERQRPSVSQLISS